MYNEEVSNLKLNEANDWLESRTILLGPAGSRAAGTSNENSDRDYRGVCIPPVSFYLGLDSFNEYNTAGGKSYKNTKDDIDTTIMHINKFVREAMVGAVNCIDLLFLRPEDYLIVHELGQLLLDNRHLFLTKAVKGKFAGFANGQVKQMEHKGYNPKTFYQVMKLMTAVTEILMTGDYSTYRANRDFLMACRNEAFTYREALQMIEVADMEMQKAYEWSKLPDKPDYHKINNLLMEINRTALEL